MALILVCGVKRAGVKRAGAKRAKNLVFLEKSGVFFDSFATEITSQTMKPKIKEAFLLQ